MNVLEDPALKLKYVKSKYKVKVWESDFFKSNGRNPSKVDIRNANSKVRDAYKIYYKLKSIILNDTLRDLTFSENDGENDSFDITLSNKQSKLEQCSDSALKPVRPVLGDRVLNVEDNDRPKDQNQTLGVADATNVDFHSKAVWGKHLNKPASKEQNNDEKKSLQRSASFNLSRKLFSGSTFNKRNPRKSLSSSRMSKEVETRALSPDIFSDCSQISSNNDISSSLSVDGIRFQADENSSQSSFSELTQTSLSEVTQSSCSELTQSSIDLLSDCSQPTIQTFINSTKCFNSQTTQRISNFFVDASESLQIKVHNSTPINNQCLSAIQRVLNSDNCSQIVNKKPLNQGWLERCAQLDNIDTVNLLSSKCSNITSTSEDTMSEKTYPRNRTHISCSVDSDEDLVYSSGDERESKSSQEYRFTFKRKFSYEAQDPALERKSDPVESPTVSKRPKYVKKCNSETINSLSTNKSSNPARSDIIQPPPVDVEMLADGVIKKENTLKKKGKTNKKTSKLTKKEVLEKKLASGQANDNFVRLDLKKKIYVRGKKNWSYTKYKKTQWKKKKSGAVYDGPTKELSTCFKCGDIGHWAGDCKYTGDKLLPQDDESTPEESNYPTLEEVEAMCSEPQNSTKKFTQNVVMLDINNPGQAEIINCDQIITNHAKPPYQLNEDGSLMDTPPEVYEALEMFGHECFRPGQEEAVMRVLSGLSTLVTLSTGSGKSLCYQLPAYIMAQKAACITLVVSPLVSLMEDQVTGVASFLKAACLHTNQTPKQRLKVMEQAKSGDLHILLVSPEAVVSGEKASGFGSILKELPPIGFACIDEAHCVSQWSHNFRPSYLVICKVLREKLGISTVLGLTATATKETCDSIVKHLSIPDGMNGVIKDIPLPDNLVLSVSKDENRDRALTSLLQGARFKDFNSIIVYCTRQAECERLAALLRTCLKTSNVASSSKRSSLSCTCEPYHAGLSASKRKQVQKAFMNGNLRIVVATVAFGMGINKADIRAVIHYNMPRNFESYVQEVGRAGRDGLPAHCHLFLDSKGGDQSELRRHIYSDSVDRHTIRKLLQRVFVPCKCVPLTELLDGVDLNEKFEDGQSLSHTNDKEGNSGNGVKSTEGHHKLKVQCPGHEVAFGIDDTVQALDFPKENISTLLCYLELHSRRWIKVLSPVYTTCTVLSYKGTKGLKEAANLSPPLAMAIALDQRRGISHEKSTRIEFPVVGIAAMIGWDSGTVKHNLKNLEWKKVDERWQRTGVTVEFTELGFRVMAPGNLRPRELDSALDSLYGRVNDQEQKSLLQLQTLFKSLSSVAYSTCTDCSGNVDAARSNDLKQQIRKYFDQETPEEELVVEKTLPNEEQIVADIRAMVCSFRDQTFTGRAVARIFHGISSPCFPAVVWGKNRFWRSHLHADFKLLCHVAAREILRLR